MNLALEEWRHWLEGTKSPILVWTNHKNLEYIHSAKRLNFRQARWSLFFTRFNISLPFAGLPQCQTRRLVSSVRGRGKNRP